MGLNILPADPTKGVLSCIATLNHAQPWVNPVILGLMNVVLNYPAHDSQPATALLDQPHAHQPLIVYSTEQPAALNGVEFHFLRHRVGLTHVRLRNVAAGIYMTDFRVQGRNRCRFRIRVVPLRSLTLHACILFVRSTLCVCFVFLCCLTMCWRWLPTLSRCKFCSRLCCCCESGTC
jgi:hypothetical protein